jgi:hypothetical protein
MSWSARLPCGKLRVFVDVRVFDVYVKAWRLPEFVLVWPDAFTVQIGRAAK